MTGQSMVERVARALVASRGATVVASDKHWPTTAANYYALCAAHPHYAAEGSLVTDAFRDAKVAIEAMREPTLGMVRAMCIFQTDEIGDPVAMDEASVWRIAIDAALTQPSGGER